MADLNNRDLALVLLDRLADFETERIAMANLLDFARYPDTNRPLDWRPMVQASRSEKLRGIAYARYAEIERTLQDSTSDCPNALSLLELASRGLVSEPYK